MGKNTARRGMAMIVGTLLVALVLVILLAATGQPGGFSAAAAAPTPGGNVIYLPVVFRRFPLRTVFGVETQRGLFSGQGLEEIVASDATWVRRNMALWADVEPNEGERDWSALSGMEQELINATQNGLIPIVIVRRTPDWAQQVPGSYCGPIKSDKMEAFGNFMYDLVARYSKPPYNVKYWEIWNEPDVFVNQTDNVFGCWGDTGDPYYGGGYYAQALIAIYPRIKQADPTAKVLVGGLLLDCDPDNPPAGKDCTPSKFLEGILRAGGAPYFDGISFHAYDYYGDALGVYSNFNWEISWDTTGPGLIKKVRFLKDVLARYGVSGKEFFNTETAVICDDRYVTCDSTYEQTKAYYVPQTYAAAIAEGLTGNVWYSLFGWRHSGLLESDLDPLPAYHAFVFGRRELDGATFVSEITAYAGVQGYEFNRDGTTLWVIWSKDGRDHSLDLPSTPTAVYDSFGNPKTASDPLDLIFADGPLYVELP